jgi:hypothetical protein
VLTLPGEWIQWVLHVQRGLDFHGDLHVIGLFASG